MSVYLRDTELSESLFYNIDTVAQNRLAVLNLTKGRNFLRVATLLHLVDCAEGLSITTTKDKEFKYTYIHTFFL